jgi:outer membrane protein insertion porin family
LHSLKPFLTALKEADKNRMLIKYGEIGDIDAQIVAEPRFTDQPGVVDLLYNIEEHGQFMSSELRFRGNARTEDKAIRRKSVMSSLSPGDAAPRNP